MSDSKIHLLIVVSIKHHMFKIVVRIHKHVTWITNNNFNWSFHATADLKSRNRLWSRWKMEVKKKHKRYKRTSNFFPIKKWWLHTFSDLPHWPPSPSVETLLMFNEEEEVHYDLNKAIQMVKKRPGTKKSAHCVLYSHKSKGDYRILVSFIS